MNKRILFLMTGIGIFLAFVFFSYLVHKDFFTQFDFNTTVRLQDKIPRRFDGLFSWLSEIGKFEVMTVVLLVVLAIRRKIWGIIPFLLYVALHLFELYGKFFVEHFPPPEFMLRTEHLLNFPQFHVRAENSYPSGHAARAVFLAVLIAFLVWQSKRIKLPQKVFVWGALIGYDLLMIVSRVYLGEHWTSDVIGGSLLGGGLALISLIVW